MRLRGGGGGGAGGGCGRAYRHISPRLSRLARVCRHRPPGRRLRVNRNQLRGPVTGNVWSWPPTGRPGAAGSLAARPLTLPRNCRLMWAALEQQLHLIDIWSGTVVAASALKLPEIKSRGVCGVNYTVCWTGETAGKLGRKKGDR